MKSLMPTVAEERWMLASERWDLGEEGDRGGWKRASTFARCAFFILGALTVLGMYGFAWVAKQSAAGASIVTVIGCVGLAEYLIIERRVFGYGFEEALELLGLCTLAFIRVDHFSEDFASLTLTLVCALVAVRLRNPFALTCALAASFWFLQRHADVPSVAAGCWIAAIAVWLALTREVKRPSNQRILEWMSVVLPISGYLWMKNFDFERWDAPPSIEEGLGAGVTTAGLLLVVAAALALFIGLRNRQHSLLLAAAACAAGAAYELRHMIPLSMEVKFVVCGIATLVFSLAAERLLRRNHGVSSLPWKGEGNWRLLEAAAAVAITAARSAPRHEQPATGTRAEGEGRFGGAGASGDY